MTSFLKSAILIGILSIVVSAELEQAVRVVRFRVDYPNADLSQLSKYSNWATILRKSVLASLKFVNKHWEVCGEAEKLDKVVGAQNDCGKLQVTGEIVENNHYRINATFIANRDPIKNTKVEATSTVYGVIQIGLRGGIFQYTNAMKLLGKPSPVLEFEDAYFCYPEYELVNESQCRLRPESRRRISRNTVKRRGR
ncbi:unnamed protein product [Bursaphelenchus xylophilus]|uniref:(pine wood nematode) hypothetical protein n=1 Tax=Bursaphelenchus xylophilus TaxID=6326 RepID=A0A1I7S2K1_BURXY|nr:unnamed protein product [Bursaphelenchus xylophilus]CAG9121895.1 unnamed protein product [Bursaphelenchus xylophilus]